MTTDAVGGVWTYATGLALALCRRGHEVALVTLGPPPRRDQMERLRLAAGPTVEVTDLALEWMDPEGNDMARAAGRLRRLVDRFEPDIIHLNGFREATYGFAPPSLVVAHSCVGSWWRACRPNRPLDASWQPYLRHAASGLDAADAWAAPTAAYRGWLEAHYRPRRSGHAIWNGVAVAPAATDKQPFILAAGRLWDEAKNIAAVAAVASALDWPVRLAGPTKSPNGSSGKVARGLVVLGAVPHAEMIAQMRRASIFVAPALYEPFGLTVLEAALCGCALILSDIPTFRELWDGAALFVGPRDAGALAHALRRLCADAVLRAKLVRAAQARARRYSLDAMLDDYRCLYGTLHGRRADIRTGGAQPAMELGA